MHRSVLILIGGLLMTSCLSAGESPVASDSVEYDVVDMPELTGTGQLRLVSIADDTPLIGRTDRLELSGLSASASVVLPLTTGTWRPVTPQRESGALALYTAEVGGRREFVRARTEGEYMLIEWMGIDADSCEQWSILETFSVAGLALSAADRAVNTVDVPVCSCANSDGRLRCTVRE